MGKFLTALVGLFAGAQPGAQADVQMVDPRTPLFSMSTIADEMAPVEPMTAQPTPEDVVLHEDEWRQIEFFPASRIEDVKQELRELARFEAANRTEQGFFRHVFVRHLPPPVPVAGTVEALAHELGAQIGPGLVFFAGQSLVGRAASGFILRLPSNVVLYGFTGRAGIMVLGANVGEGGDHAALTSAFLTLHRNRGLIAVDWRAHMILAGISADGQIEVWRPD
jgi:hypothetical protein